MKSRSVLCSHNFCGSHEQCDRCSAASRADPRDEAPQKEGQAAGREGGGALAAVTQTELWSEAVQIQEAKERAIWHEKMSRHNLEQSEVLQVKLAYPSERPQLLCAQTAGLLGWIRQSAWYHCRV